MQTGATGLEFAYDLIQTEPVPIPRRVFVIAEIGINHNGSLDLAKLLIQMAKNAGCDAVKFQKRTIDVVYPKEVLDQPRESPWGTTQREQKVGLEFGRSEYDQIDAFCRKLGIEWFASAWDIPSLHFLRPYNCKYSKIASAMITHTRFLEAVAMEHRPTFVSTGMANLPTIDRAVEIFRKHECPIVLMHTVSTYPTDEEDLNLRVLQGLRERFGVPVGYSGHETSVSPTVMACMLGAVAVERHITVDRAMYGSDQAASLEKPGIETLVAQIRKLPVVLGDGVKRFSQKEIAVANKLRYWRPSEQVADE